MRVGILAGGKGTRLAEETRVRPKPMVEIGGRPILWHIMRQHAHFGHSQFVVGLGYKGDFIKRYMLDQAVIHGDLSVNMRTGDVTFVHPLAVSEVGPFVGNAGSSPPPHTALVDYVFDTNSPIVPEDANSLVCS